MNGFTPTEVAFLLGLVIGGSAGAVIIAALFATKPVPAETVAPYNPVGLNVRPATDWEIACAHLGYDADGRITKRERYAA